MTKAAIKKQIHAAVDIIDSEQLLNAVYVILNSELERKKEAMSPFTLEEFYTRNNQSQKEIKQGKLVAHRDVKAKYTLKQKMVKLYWTQSALKNLDKIHRYILDQTLSEVIANRYVLKLIMRVEQLKIYPESGQVELLLRKISQNSRYLIEGNYKIIYQVQNSSVIVTDVFHVKQNPTKINSNIKK